jgi:murein L,D-transpeptidase YcbB/YkuD
MFTGHSIINLLVEVATRGRPVLNTGESRRQQQLKQQVFSAASVSLVWQSGITVWNQVASKAVTHSSSGLKPRHTRTLSAPGQTLQASLAAQRLQTVFAMATDYLEKYIESVSDLPAQLQRKFRLIRDLDEKSAKLQVSRPWQQLCADRSLWHDTALAAWLGV